MLEKTTRSVTAVLALTVLTGGCANDMKARITMLEEANTNLTEQLNYSRGELDAAYREREDLTGRLAEAARELDDLHAQLARGPEPEPTAQGWTAVPGGAMIAIEGSVLFAPGQASLRKDSRRTLDAVASTLQGEYGGKDILVFGHTDDQPIRKSGWTDNWQLSTERSLAVVRHLSDQGITISRLVACGCGEHRPRVPNTSPANRAKNRRVEIFAIEPQTHTAP